MSDFGFLGAFLGSYSGIVVVTVTGIVAIHLVIRNILALLAEPGDSLGAKILASRDKKRRDKILAKDEEIARLTVTWDERFKEFKTHTAKAEARLEGRIDALDTEVRELRVLTARQAAAIETLSKWGWTLTDQVEALGGEPVLPPSAVLARE